MPSTIPYDPSLVLGNLVSQEKLDNLMKIAELQGPANAAEDTLNSFISLKRSLDMTVQDLMNMNIDIFSEIELMEEVEEVTQKLKDAAIAFAKAKMQAELKSQPLRAKILGISNNIESPIDYNKTKIKTDLPLAADSLKMNVQYFSYDENTQTSDTHASTIKAFVSDELSSFNPFFMSGETTKTQASAAVQSQVNSQHAHHSIAGTLVISITCTHKNAVLLAPYILDVDKAIRVWNDVFPKDKISADGSPSISLFGGEQQKKNALTLISGATYGSCFIGMVHVLNTTDTKASETMYSVAASLQEQFTVWAAIEREKGGFGVDASFSEDAKNLLSTQSISSHCTLVTMGSIPSIKSNEVQLGVQSFADDDGAKSMATLQKIQNATAADHNSIQQSAEAARTGKQMIALQTSKVEAALSSLAKIDDGKNKMLDINSMMDAMEDYINKCLAGNIGVPINYYLKKIDKQELEDLWENKYFPGNFLVADSGDDSDDLKKKGSASATKKSSDDSKGDSGSDSGGDSGSDSGGDSGSDSGGDSGSDSGGDSGSDSGGDSGSDSGGGQS